MANTHQTEKYGKGFQSDLDESQEFVNFCCGYFNHKGFTVQPQSDKIPYIDHNGKKVRLWDANLINPNPSFPDCKMECKDFCQTIFYPVTGLPIEYVDKIMTFCNPSKIIFIFRDNMGFIENFLEEQPYNNYFCKGRSKIAKVSRQELLQDMIDKKFLVLHKGSYIFVPYGNFLSELMKNIVHTKNDVPCKWKNWGKAPQYLWDIGAFKQIGVLAEEVKNMKE